MPGDYTPTDQRVTDISTGVDKVLFTGINSSATGMAIYNTANNVTVNILADFVNNKTTGNYGAIGNYGTSAKIGSITGDFINNKANYHAGIANLGGAYIGVIRGDFIANSNTSAQSGAAIQNQTSRIDAIYGDFIGNVSKKSAGGVNNDVGTIGNIVGNFIGNVATAGTTGGAGIVNYNGTMGDITGDFIGNYSLGGNGGAIGNYANSNGVSLGNITGDFIGNYTKGQKGGGAIIIDVVGAYTLSIGNIEGDFISNYVNQTGSYNAAGGAIYTAAPINNEDGGIINASFIGNYVKVTTSGKTAKGGAIYTTKDLNFIARDDVTAIYSGNYVETSTGLKENQAIYVDSTSAVLNFNAYDGGKFLIYDVITGKSGGTALASDRYKLNLSGVNAGDIMINNTVSNAEITLNNDNVLDGSDLALSNSKLNMNNDTPGDMELSSLTLSGTNWLALDIAETSPYALDADTITTTTSGSGTLTIYDINYMGEASSTSRKVQILYSDSALQLALSSSSFTQTFPDYDVVTSVNQNTSWTDTYTATHYSNVSRTINVILDTTTNTHDSLTITSVTESSTSSTQPIDTLRAINQAELVGPRSFTTSDETAIYNVTSNIGETTSGNFTVQGAVSGSDISTLNFGSYTAFELSNPSTTLTFEDVKVTGTNNLVTVSDGSAVVNINNSYIDGNIVSATPSVKQGTVNVNSAAADTTTFTGNVSVDTLNLNSGTLKLTTTADISGTGEFVADGGKLDVQDSQMVNYTINDLTLNNDMNYAFDIDLYNVSTDRLILASTLTNPDDSNIVVDNINLITNTTRRVTNVAIADSNLAGLFTPSGGDWKAISSYVSGVAYDGASVTYNSVTGILTFIKYVLSDRTLDRINNESVAYINDPTRGTIQLSATKGTNPNSVVINGTKLWYTPTDDALVNLVATGSGALKEVVDPAGAVFSYDNGVTTKYYTYDTADLPISTWTRSEVQSTDNWNYYRTEVNGDKTYYRVNIETGRLGQSESVTWSENLSGGQTGSVTVNLPNNDTRTLYYSYIEPNNYDVAPDRVTNISVEGVVNEKIFKNMVATSVDALDGVAVSNTTNNSNVDILSDFINNRNESQGNYGAVYNSSKGRIGSITGDFIGNYSLGSGAAIANIKGVIGNIVGDFIDNNQTNQAVSGGAIYNTGTIGDIAGDFIGNYCARSGGAIQNQDDGVIGSIEGDFIANTSRFGSTGGAGVNNYNGVVGNVSGDFIANSSFGSGGALSNHKGVAGNYSMGDIVGDFIGNYVYHTSTSDSNGGAIHNEYVTGSGTFSIGNITGDFIANYVYSPNSVKGGAIFTNSEIGSANGGIINSSFINNYVYTTNSAKTAQGGAIYTDTNLNIIANDGITSLFSGNYVQAGSGGDKISEAIYVNSSSAVLTFRASGGGKFVINDAIRGVSAGTDKDSARYTIAFNGVSAGDVLMNNTIENANITVNNDNDIETSQ